VKLLAAAFLGAALLLCPLRAGAGRPLNPCVTTDPVVVLGTEILPSQTVCIPPQ
jgi:hypothetical protein